MPINFGAYIQPDSVGVGNGTVYAILSNTYDAEVNMKILIHDERTEYRFYGNMTDLSEKLEDFGFLCI